MSRFSYATFNSPSPTPAIHLPCGCSPFPRIWASLLGWQLKKKSECTLMGPFGIDEAVTRSQTLTCWNLLAEAEIGTYSVSGPDTQTHTHMHTRPWPPLARSSFLSECSACLNFRVTRRRSKTVTDWSTLHCTYCVKCEIKSNCTFLSRGLLFYFLSSHFHVSFK